MEVKMIKCRKRSDMEQNRGQCQHNNFLHEHITIFFLPPLKLLFKKIERPVRLNNYRKQKMANAACDLALHKWRLSINTPRSDKIEGL